jgi:hypothetical protein
MKATAGDQCSTSAKKAAGEQAEDGAAAACCMLQQKNKDKPRVFLLASPKTKPPSCPLPKPQPRPGSTPTTGDDASRNSLPMFFFSFLSQDKTRGETKMNRSSFIFWLEIKMKFVHSKNKIVRKK